MLRQSNELRGQPLAAGYAQGKARVYAPVSRPVSGQDRNIAHGQVEEEIQRFESALSISRNELETIRSELVADIGDAEAAIFEAHLLFLEDPEFLQRCRNRIRNDLQRVELAVEKEIREIEELFAQLDSGHLRERAQDMRDVGNRILLNLQPQRKRKSPREVAPGTVIVAHELFPSETVTLDRKHVVGIVVEQGGYSSHAAILARGLGIPMITAVDGLLERVKTGDKLLVDAISGRIRIEPSAQQSKRFAARSSDYEEIRDQLAENEGLACRTLDGVSIDLFANVGRIDELQMVRDHHLNGVGLFRTEMLFMNSKTPPDMRKQHRLYKRATSTLQGLPIVFRTVDLGDDKQPPYLDVLNSGNRGLGARGLRYSLQEGRMFRTQLRAILRGCDPERASIMFPMVLGADDFSQAKEELIRQASKEGLTMMPKIGAMIETPSSLFQLPEIMAESDFVSIGTNDLTQYVLAADRGVASMIQQDTFFHTSVLRAVKQVIEFAEAAKVPVSVCGEAAGDVAGAAVLIGLGVRKLSMSPMRSPFVAGLVRNMSIPEFESIASLAEGGEIPNRRDLLQNVL